MDRLKREIEMTRKEHEELKRKEKWASDTWFALSKEVSGMSQSNSDYKKKEKDCENQAQLAKQLREALDKNEATMQRLSQNLLFFFEEDLLQATPSGKPNKPSKESSSESAAAASGGAKEGKKDTVESTGNDHAINAFRKNLLGYCHLSHGVGEDLEAWKEKLPTLIKRAEKRLPAEKVASYKAIANGPMNDLQEVRNKLIIWYVENFPNERKPKGYFEAAGLPVPAKKTPGKKKEGEASSDNEDTTEEAPVAKKPAVKTPSAAAPPTPSTKPGSSKPGKAAPPSSSSSSSSDDSSSESEEDIKPVVKKMKLTEQPVVSSKKEDKKKPKKEEVREPEESPAPKEKKQKKESTSENLAKQTAASSSKKNKA